MATYLVKSEKEIIRQEGDTADIVFVVPTAIDMARYHVKFVVANSTSGAIVSKCSAEGTITVDGQTITIPLLIPDTKRKPGKHLWELEIYNDTPEVITIGRGVFHILNERIR